MKTMPGAAAKRTLDIAFAGTGLLLSSPLWLAIAIAIKGESPGPVPGDGLDCHVHLLPYCRTPIQWHWSPTERSPLPAATVLSKIS